MNNKQLFIAFSFIFAASTIHHTYSTTICYIVDDQILIAAQAKLNQDLITIFSACDVHNLSEITPDNFSYHDYLYWSGTLGWNTYLTYLYWQNYFLYAALTAKSDEHAQHYLADSAIYGDNTTRIYQEAALPYLQTLEDAGITNFTAQQILPKDELWQYLNSSERYYYINAIKNLEKRNEVRLLHEMYKKEQEAEEYAAREARDQEQQETHHETSSPPHIRTDDAAQEKVRIAAEQRMIDQILEANMP